MICNTIYYYIHIYVHIPGINIIINNKIIFNIIINTAAQFKVYIKKKRIDVVIIKCTNNDGINLNYLKF